MLPTQTFQPEQVMTTAATPVFQTQPQQFVPQQQEPHRMTTDHTPVELPTQQPSREQVMTTMPTPVFQTQQQQIAPQQEQQAPMRSQVRPQRPMNTQQVRTQKTQADRNMEILENANWRDKTGKFRRPDLQSSGWTLNKDWAHQHAKPFQIDQFPHERLGYRKPLFSTIQPSAHKLNGHFKRLGHRG